MNGIDFFFSCKNSLHQQRYKAPCDPWLGDIVGRTKFVSFGMIFIQRKIRPINLQY